MEITVDDPMRDDVLELMAEHLADMQATSPPESVHALDAAGLAAPDITFYTARVEGQLLGSGALRELSPTEGEIKSMRTREAARGAGVASLLLGQLLIEARNRGYARVNLETGSEDYFLPARRLYARHGFVECGPFGDYVEDPNSIFMTFDLSADRATS